MMGAPLNTDKFGIRASLEAWIKKSWAPLLAVMSIFIFIACTWLPASNKMTQGFAAYYASSRLILDHRGGVLLYDDSAFQAEVESLTEGRAGDIYWANPPTTTLLFLPLAKLSIGRARYVWMVLSLIALLLAMSMLGFAIFKLPFQTKAFYIASSLLFLSAPLAENFRFGQAYVVILAFYALALFALCSHRDWWAGLWLGLVLVLKGSGIPLLVLLLFRGKWRVVMSALLTSATLALFSLPWIGPAAWRIYLFDVVPRFLVDPVIAVTAYQTMPGFTQHMFTYHDIWNPGPLVIWPLFAKISSLLTGFMFMGTAALHSRRAVLEWTFCVGLLLSVILVPAAEQYHYVLLFPAFLLAVHAPAVPKVPLYISAALIAWPLDYMTKTLASGWWALVAYPRLYGAIILFIILRFHHEDSKLGSSNEATKLDAVAGVE